MNRIVLGRRAQIGGKDKSILGVHGGVLLKSEMRFVIFDRPVRFQIPGKLFQVAVFIQLSLRCLSLFLGSLSCSLEIGRLADFTAYIVHKNINNFNKIYPF